jgi:sugar lactone lactonase YvrE
LSPSISKTNDEPSLRHPYNNLIGTKFYDSVDFTAVRSSYLEESTLKRGRMPQENSFRSEAAVIATGLAMGESPRWHDGKLWVSDWGAQEILAIDSQGDREAMVRTSFELPVCIDWLPNGLLLIVAGRENRVVRREANGSLVTYANLRNISDEAWNEIVVDGRGNAYINGGSGAIALVKKDGSVRQVAGDIAFPNGMAITPDNKTLIIAESYGRKLTAFDIDAGGSLSNRRVWADLETGVPDGICIDAEQAVWYADVPNKCCVRVREGGEVLQRVRVDRGCFACMLGGSDRRTLFIVATEWRGMDKIAEVARNRTGQILSIPAPASGAGWP